MVIPTTKSTRWLTYQQRVRADLEEALAAPEAAAFFNADYLASLAAPVKQQDEWILKLFLLQATLIGFLAIGFISPDSKLSAFGFDLKNVDGLREILLAISSTIALAIFGLSSARDTTIFMLNVISDRLHPPSLQHYARYVVPSAFNMRLYVARQFSRWQFPRYPQKTFWAIVGLLGLTMFGIAFTASLSVHWLLIKEIWRHPGLGRWSTAALVYVGCCYVVNICLLVNRWLWLPYTDVSELKKANARKSG